MYITEMEIPDGYKLIKINFEARKAAQKKYYEANRAKINVIRLLKYKERYNNDEEFRAKERLRNLENSRKKKV